MARRRGALPLGGKQKPLARITYPSLSHSLSDARNERVQKGEGVVAREGRASSYIYICMYVYIEREATTGRQPFCRA